jgi:anti-sigma factor ChrR (cupin superfamily)
MRHAGADERMTEMAALYALGSLSQHEARAFEDHLGECAECRSEVESFEATALALAIADEQEPPPRLRDELTGRLNGAPAEEKRPPGCFEEIASIHTGDGQWVEISAGIHAKTLNYDKSSGLVTSLMKMEPGTALPVHRHRGVEQFFILEGDCYVHGEKLGPGDFHRAVTGSVHQETYTVEGTLFLLIAPEDFEVLDAR